MKVVAFNGSPKRDGNTARLIGHVFSELEKEGIGTEMVQLGGNMVSGCRACERCWENKDGHCVVKKDMINDCIDKMVEADGIIIGSPTYFANVNTETKALIDRAGFVGLANGGLFKRKVGAAVAVNRRSGSIHAFNSINHLFTISEMFVVGSTYWNLGVGLKPGDVDEDEESVRIMRDLGRNMAWLLKRVRD